MKTERRNRRFYIVIALSLVFLLVFGALVYAEYIKKSRAKRVIASYGDEGSLFSSNYLVMNVNPSVNVYKRLFYTNNPDSPANGAVSICNYAQGNPSRVYESDIEYTLTARLVTIGESNGVYVKNNASSSDVGAHTVKLQYKGGGIVTLSSSNISHTFASSTLDHRNTSTDIVSVEFDSDFKSAGALCLYLCATPVRAQSGIHTLDAVFGVSLNSAEARSVWEGEFNEKTNVGVPVQPYYDGFNYMIAGTGKGSCTLTWNNEKLKISQVFLSVNGFTESVSGNQSSVTFQVDSDIQNRYDLQFYYADESVSFSDWDELTGGLSGDGYVRLVYTESTD